MTSKRKPTSIADFFNKRIRIPDDVSEASAGGSDGVLNALPNADSSVVSLPAAESVSVPTSGITLPMDIGMYCQLSLTDEERYRLITETWVPSQSFKFPQQIAKGDSGKGRSFRLSWLKNFAWLAYSGLHDGAYCKYCVIFARRNGTRNSRKLDKLYTSPLTYWASASSKFNDHEKTSPVHKDAVVAFHNFVQVMEARQHSVILQMDSARVARVNSNRKKLLSILKTVVLCGRQNIPLRGHRDDNQHLARDGNCGNFQALLDFRIESGDHLLQKHFETAPRNATYRSKTVQNELIEACGEDIRGQIVERIKQCSVFSVLADEAQDSANREQLPIVVRYVDAKNVITEDFLGYVDCIEGVSGEAIAKYIIDFVTTVGLDMNMCRGQCYDGAGNMAGRLKGTASRILAEYPKAVYTHCNSHRLNLCVVQACSIPAVRNMMGTMGEVARFFSFSPKRTLMLEDAIKKLEPSTTHTKLLDVCRTRWIERIDAMEVFISLLESVSEALESMRSNSGGHWNSDTVTKANCNMRAMLNFEFIFTLVMCKEALAYIRGLTVALQSRSLDFLAATQHISSVNATLKNVRENIDVKHREWYATAADLAETLHVPVAKPRTCGRQQHRANPQSTTPEDYFRSAVSVPFLDHINKEMSDRFGKQHATVVGAYQLLPAHCVVRGSEQWKQEVMMFLESILDDLPSVSSLQAELDIWRTICMESAEKPTAVTGALNMVNKSLMPNVCAALKLLGVLPVTSCECERSVSALRRLKTYQRSTMGEERLNGLAALHVHYTIAVNEEAILNKFARKHPRKMELLNILSD